nr:MAG TPA: hypothetical protein [Caudoviricetes sp.]
MIEMYVYRNVGSTGFVGRVVGYIIGYIVVLI